MTRLTALLAAFALTLTLVAGPAHAWGRNGHRIIGEIASNHVSPRTAGAVQELLGPVSLAQAGTWADEVRSDDAYDYAAPWHYVNIEDGETYETAEKNPDGDVLEAMMRLENVLRDPEVAREEKAEALKFLVHFVADVHQPLHVGYKADRGGNEITVLWFGEPSNLHRVWDSGLIEAEQLSFTEWVRFLGRPSAEQVVEWQDSSYLDWAAEAMAARPQVYDFSVEGERGAEEIPRLGYRYAYYNLPRVRENLLEAGVRLAGLLDAIFDPSENP